MRPKPDKLRVDDARIDALHVLVADPEAFHGSFSVVLDGHIGFGQQSPRDAASLIGLQIQRDPSLVAIHHEEGGGFSVHVGWQGAPRVVAAGHLLDLDHVGPHVGQHQSAHGAGHDVRELDDLESCERSHFSAR